MRIELLSVTLGCGLVLSSVACSGESFSDAKHENVTGGAAGDAGDGGGDGGTAGSGGTSGGGGQGGTGGQAGGGTGGASGSGGGSGGSAGSCGFEESDVRCVAAEPAFPEFEKGCVSNGDCALVSRAANCCGDGLYVGVNHAAAACFEQAARICNSQFPACGCPTVGASAEDGTFVPWDRIDGIIVQCTGGLCKSRWGGSVFECGDKRCIDGQRCDVLMPGVAGVPPSYSCGYLPPGCNDCSCAGGTDTGCQCVVEGGHVTVTCYAP